METLVSPGRRRLMVAASAAALVSASHARAQGSGTPRVAEIAVIGEPGVIDPMLTLADLVNGIDQHFFETLYAHDPSFRIAPVLAAVMPEITENGRVYTIRLRENVPFHDGTIMTADDVTASIRRWLKLSPRAQAAAPLVSSVESPAAATVRITLKEPYSPLLMLMSVFNGALAIMPQRLAASTDPIKEYIGTGPYCLTDRQQDRYIRLQRFDRYASPPGKPSAFIGEKRAAIEELRFVPVPNPTTRADGLISGQYHFADSLTTESFMKLKSQTLCQPGRMITPSWALLAMNTKGGITSNPFIRRAVMAAVSPADMLAAAFGPPELWTPTGSIYPEGTELHDPATPGYNEQDRKKAGALMKQAGYGGQPFRILTTTQYDYMFKIAQVAGANLEDAGFKVDVQVMDWATLLQRRNDSNIWEAFVTSGPILPDPTLFSPFNPNYAGWWDTPTKREALRLYVSAPDQAARMAAWKRMHALFYEETPSVLLGHFALLYGISTKLADFTPAQPPAFWNVSLKS